MSTVKITKLQKDILDIMKSQDGYNNPSWGFSAMGYREIAEILNKNPTSINNSMLNLYNKGVFVNRRSKNRWDDFKYYLNNPKYKEDSGVQYEV